MKRPAITFLPSRPRNPVVLAARMRKAGTLRDRRAKRGGAYNLQREWLAEWVEKQEERNEREKEVDR